MKKILTATLIFLSVLPVTAWAYTIDLYSHEGLSGSSWATITGDQTNTIAFDIGLGDEFIGDIRAFYFDLEGDLESSDVTGITVTALTDRNSDYTLDSVVTNWPTPSENAGMQGAGAFDFGIEFGEQGIGNKKGDISAVTFIIESAVTLTLGEDFGMRLMSVGDGRNESRKMIGSYGGETPDPVPEPATMALLGIGLLGVAAIGRKRMQS